MLCLLTLLDRDWHSHMSLLDDLKGVCTEILPRGQCWHKKLKNDYDNLMDKLTEFKVVKRLIIISSPNSAFIAIYHVN